MCPKLHLNDNDPNDSMFELPGYMFYQRNRTNGPGGGVGIYVKESLKLKRRADLEHANLEGLWLEILVKNSKSFLFGCFYRPPETSKYLPKEYNAFVSENLRSIDMEQKEVILMDDFNVNYKDKSTKGEFKSIFRLQGYKQVIKSPTRITKDSSSLIDLIFSNKPSNLSSTAVVSASLSDHDLIGCIRKINCHKHSSRTIKCRDYRNYDSYKLVNDAYNIDWNPIYNNNFDVNAAVNYFTGQLKELFDEHAPIIEKRVREGGIKQT